MHHAALDRPRPHDRDLDHQVVEAARLQARQHAHLRAALDLEHADRVGLADHVVGGRSSAGIVLHARNGARAELAAPMNSSARRIALSMPSARMSTFSRPSASRSSLSHWITLRSAIAAFSTGTSSRELVARDDEAAGVLRQVARKADQLLRQLDPLLHQRRLGVEAVLAQALGEPMLRPSNQCWLLRDRVDALAGRCRARGRRRAAPSAAGS